MVRFAFVFSIVAFAFSVFVIYKTNHESNISGNTSNSASLSIYNVNGNQYICPEYATFDAKALTCVIDNKSGLAHGN